MSSETKSLSQIKRLSQHFRFLTEADTEQQFESPKLRLKKSQLHLKEILFDHREELANLQNTNDLTAQQRTQYKRIKQNEQVFNELLDNMNRRKLTFMNFSFKSSELDEDPYMKPIIKGIYEQQKKGSMLVTELWTKDQVREYLKKSDLQRPKRILKRFAHWQWDQNTKPDKLKDISEQLKVDLFTKNSEVITKKKLESWNGEKTLKRRIRNQWLSDHMDFQTGIRNFGNYIKNIRSSEILPMHPKLSLKQIQAKE